MRDEDPIVRRDLSRDRERGARDPGLKRVSLSSRLNKHRGEAVLTTNQKIL